LKAEPLWQAENAAHPKPKFFRNVLERRSDLGVSFGLIGGHDNLKVSLQ
jgi:hypothetical protein